MKQKKYSDITIEEIKEKIENGIGCEMNGVIGMFLASTSSTALGVLTAMHENLSPSSIVGAGALGLSLGSLLFASSYKIMHIIEEWSLKNPNLDEEERKGLLKKIIESKFNQIANLSKVNKRAIEEVKETQSNLIKSSFIAKERLILSKRNSVRTELKQDLVFDNNKNQANNLGLLEIPSSVLNSINDRKKQIDEKFPEAQETEIITRQNFTSKIEQIRGGEISLETRKIISALRK